MTASDHFIWTRVRDAFVAQSVYGQKKVRQGGGLIARASKSLHGIRYEYSDEDVR